LTILFIYYILIVDHLWIFFLIYSLIFVRQFCVIVRATVSPGWVI